MRERRPLAPCGLPLGIVGIKRPVICIPLPVSTSTVRQLLSINLSLSTGRVTVFSGALLGNVDRWLDICRWRWPCRGPSILEGAESPHPGIVAEMIAKLYVVGC